jgi:hypothetical protein
MFVYLFNPPPYVYYVDQTEANWGFPKFIITQMDGLPRRLFFYFFKMIFRLFANYRSPLFDIV